jgi:hypothetical protein
LLSIRSRKFIIELAIVDVGVFDAVEEAGVNAKSSIRAHLGVGSLISARASGPIFLHCF